MKNLNNILNLKYLHLKIIKKEIDYVVYNNEIIVLSKNIMDKLKLEKGQEVNHQIYIKIVDFYIKIEKMINAMDSQNEKFAERETKKIISRFLNKI